MTARARLVLEDCKLALQLLENETDLRRWRLHWVSAIALIRAVGHVLDKVDGKSKAVSHRVYAVTKNGERNFWAPIGAAWAHSDGEGFNVKLDYLPLNGADIVIRKPKAEVDPADVVPEIANA
jgi:hypothetical protein